MSNSTNTFDKVKLINNQLAKIKKLYKQNFKQFKVIKTI